MILDTIVETKKREIFEKKSRRSIDQIQKRTDQRRFMKSGYIAEIKLASPSAGQLGRKEEILDRVKSYEAGGAAAISVVTDHQYFQGDLSFIQLIKDQVSLPILCKDFIIDRYQILEAVESGADALLLIAKIISEETLNDFVEETMALRVAPVVEVQNEKELQSALKANVRYIAVNARNLSDFSIDIEEACKLIRLIPADKIALGFSGVISKDDVKSYQQSGAKGILVGTALMKSKNPEELLRSLLV